MKSKKILKIKNFRTLASTLKFAKPKQLMRAFSWTNLKYFREIEMLEKDEYQLLAIESGENHSKDCIVDAIPSSKANHSELFSRNCGPTTDDYLQIFRTLPYDKLMELVIALEDPEFDMTRVYNIHEGDTFHFFHALVLTQEQTTRMRRMVLAFQSELQKPGRQEEWRRRVERESWKWYFLAVMISTSLNLVITRTIYQQLYGRSPETIEKELRHLLATEDSGPYDDSYSVSLMALRDSLDEKEEDENS